MIFTIGHSTHPIARFIELLKAHGIAALADVRSSPYSRFNSQFNREPLKASLGEAEIAYVFLGEELGARSKDPACYDGDRVDFRKLAASPLFKRGLNRLLGGTATHIVAIMCAEKEPLHCHRTILVARELEACGQKVMHIHDDGRVEAHDAAISRLRHQLKFPQQDLFGNECDALDEIYAIQAKRIAYVKSDVG